MNTTHVPYVIKTGGAVTMFLNGASVTVALDHPNYSKVIAALKSGQFDLIDSLVNIAKSVETYTAKATGKVKIEHGVITYSGIPLHTTLTTRILKMLGEGFKFDHMVRFLENLLENPSKRAVEELYSFLENYGLPITEDGHFLAYKAIRQDYFDIYTGRTHKNLVGSTQEMPRNLVDDTWGRDCSQGLHCGALKYVVDYGHFQREQAVTEGGNRLVILKVNPRDVVCVPKFEESTKMRVCKYVVLSEIKDCVTELKKIVYKSDGAELNPDAWSAPKSEPAATKTAGVKSTSSKGKFQIDINDGIAVIDYVDGYQAGEMDNTDGEKYGYSRDFSDDDPNYLAGYDDGFHGRDSQAPVDDDDDDCCGCGSCSCGDVSEDSSDVEYSKGYSMGECDFLEGASFQESLSVDDSDAYKSGYAAGFEDAQKD